MEMGEAVSKVEIHRPPRSAEEEQVHTEEMTYGEETLDEVASLLGAREEDNIMESGHSDVTPAWYKVEQESRRQEQEQVEEKRKLEQTAQFQQLMAVLQGQNDYQRRIVDDQTALKQTVEEIQGQMGIQDQVIHKSVQITEQICKDMEKRTQELLSNTEQRIIGRLDQQIKEKLSGEINSPVRIQPSSVETSNGLGGTMESIEPMAYVTKERGVRGSYGFTEDRQGFTILERAMQGKKGMVATRMPVPEANPGPSLTVESPDIAKQLSYQETSDLGEERVTIQSPLLGHDPKSSWNAPPMENSAQAPRRISNLTSPGRGMETVMDGSMRKEGVPVLTGGPMESSPPVMFPPSVGYQQPTWNGPSNNTPRNRNPGVVLPKYTGKETLQDFLLQVENAANLGEWDETYKAGRLYGQLAGSALRVANALSGEQRRSYPALVKVLQDRFEGEIERERCKEALRTCRRKKGESLMELGHRITELARKAYSENQRDEEGVVAFRGAISEELGKVLVTDRPRTVDDAVDKVASLEVYLENNRQDRKHGVVRQLQEDPSSERTGGGVYEGKVNMIGQKSGKGDGNKATSRPDDKDRPIGKSNPNPQAFTLTPREIEMIGEQVEKRLLQLWGPLLENAQAMGGPMRQSRPMAPQGPPNVGMQGRMAPPRGPNNGPGPRRGPCFTCGSETHWSRECPVRNGPGRTPFPRNQGNAGGPGPRPQARPQ